MTQDLDIDQILKGMQNPDVGKNVDSLLGAMKEVNTVLKEVQKTVDFLDRCGIKPLLVRAAGQKLGIDVDTPLAAERKGFQPASKQHAELYGHLNGMSEGELMKMFGGDKDEDKQPELTEPDSSI